MKRSCSTEWLQPSHLKLHARLIHHAHVTLDCGKQGDIGKELSPCHPHWIRLDRTGYRQVRYFSIILNFFFLGASYEVISLEKIVQFSARDRERSNKIPLVSCFSTCPFRSKIMGDSAAERFGKNPSNWMCISGLLHFRFHLLTWSSPQVTEIHIFMCYLEFFTPKILRR